LAPQAAAKRPGLRLSGSKSSLFAKGALDSSMAVCDDGVQQFLREHGMSLFSSMFVLHHYDGRKV
jgi:hypothetical protein